MNNYLYQHYKGKYRVLANYDLDTNDFPRDEHGCIDDDFNDFYMPGKKGIEIRHAGRDNLGCYVIGNSTQLGNNILRAIYKKELGKEPPKKNETMEKHLLNENIITSVTHYDDGILFIFKAEHIDDWANIFKLKHNGASISPLSSKNLPKSTYIIPEEDEAKYKALFPKDMEAIDKAQISNRSMKQMKEKFTKKQEAEMKRLCMKPRQYVHYLGKWGDLLKIVEKEINNV